MSKENSKEVSSIGKNYGWEFFIVDKDEFWDLRSVSFKLYEYKWIYNWIYGSKIVEY